MKNNKLLWGIAGIIILVIGGVLVLGLKKSNREAKEQSYVEQAQSGNIPGAKTSSRNNKKINIVGSIKPGEEKEIVFMMHDYSTVSKDTHDLEAQKKQRKPLQGKITTRLKEVGSLKELDSLHKARGDYQYYYVIYEIKGNSSNPKGNTIHPQTAEETGWDPAPQFVVYQDGKTKYPSSVYRRSILRAKNYEAPLFTPDFNQEKWQIMAAGWKLNSKPTILFKYISPDGKANYLKVED